MWLHAGFIKSNLVRILKKVAVMVNLECRLCTADLSACVLTFFPEKISQGNGTS